ncbi:Rieske (2Fe-2S) protein [bacterium]|nr:Rieske (2Fe-2S) protein [bacterium]
MIQFHPTLLLSQLTSKQVSRCVVDGLSLLLAVDSAGQVFAFENNCSHADKPLERGVWNPDTHEMICPYHRAIFDVARGGSVKVGPAFVALQVFPTEIRDFQGEKTVFVGLSNED